MAQLLCARLWGFRDEKIVTHIKITIWFTSQREEVVGFLTPSSNPTPRPTPNSEGRGEGLCSYYVLSRQNFQGPTPPKEGQVFWEVSWQFIIRPSSFLSGCSPAGPPQPCTHPSLPWSRNYAWNVKFQLVHQWGRHRIQRLVYVVFKNICRVDE